MKRLSVLLVLALLAAAVAGAQAVVPTAKTPVIQVAPGFAPELEMVKILAKRVNLPLTSNGTADAQDLVGKDGKKAYETLIVIIGASGKGLGAAGVNLDDEVARAKRLVTKAKELGMFIIGIHTGGAERRGANTAAILPVELPFLNYLIVRKDGDADGVFAKAAAQYKYPIKLIDKTTDLQGVLKQVFKLP
jgi:hypothetical protein